MQLMHKKKWGMVNGKEALPIQVCNVLEWQSRDDKTKMVTGLALSNSELHHVDLPKSSKEFGRI